MTVDLAQSSEPGRSDDGRYLPGFGGRKLGSKNKTSRNTLNAVQGLASEAVGQLAERMRQGDMSAIKLILDYTLPKGGRTVELDSSDPNCLIDAAAMRDISPDESARLAQAYKTAGEASDLRELKHQVEQLELLITAINK